MKKFRNMATKQRGFTLIELAIVVGIGFLLIGIGLYKAPALMASYRANAELQELPQVVTNIQKGYANNPNYSVVTLDSIARLDAFPQNRVTIPSSGSATAANRWGGDITFATGTINTTADIGRLIYKGVPSSECKQVILGVGQMFRRVYVDSGNSGSVGAGTLVKPDGVAVNEAMVGTGCSGASNSITYDFAK